MTKIASRVILSLFLYLSLSSIGHTKEKIYDMFGTTYDDGRSCPANCDAHVVFKKTHLNTPNAFLPASSGNPYSPRFSASREKCVYGCQCAICFGKDESSCMLATYRGSGPKVGRFDFTPAFLRAHCSEIDIPEQFETLCNSHSKNVKSLEKRINCIANPTHPNCAALIAKHTKLKDEDLPRYEKCKTFPNDKAYNKTQPDKSLHRTNSCAYFLNVPACSVAKPCGKRLTPGACRKGYFAGPYGTDCCSADTYQAAIDIVECGSFYVKK